MMFFQKMLGAISLVTLVAGCGGGSVGDVSGKVTYKDKPVTSGTVVIIVKGGIPKSGTIQPDGSFRVTGVSTGDARVMVSSPPLVSVVGAGKGAGKPDEVSDKPAESQETSTSAANPELVKTWVAIPDKYGDTNRTDLKLTVVGGTNAFDIPLN